MDPILVNLSAYGGKFQKELIGQVFKSLEEQGITILEGIKGKTHFVKLKVGRGAKPYTGIFSPADKLKYSNRTVSPEMFQYDLLIDPKQYHNSFATETMDKNSKYFDLPQEKYIWQKVIEEIADELVSFTIGKGIQGGNSLDQAANICNGFLFRRQEMIVAGKPVIVTGVVTSSNAVDKFENFYTEAMEQDAAYRRMKMVLYCSHSNKDKYVDAYREKFDSDPANWSDEEKPMYLKKGKKGKVVIESVDWLGDSNALILAPKENMVLATDKLSDINVINMVPDVYQLKVGITSSIDIQIIDDDAVWFNEQQ